MRASYEWLKQLSGVDAPASDVAKRLTQAGLEVEAQHRFGAGLDRVVIAEVRAAKPHPKKDNLRVATVFDGAAEIEVVCGAPNLPGAGGRVLFAQVGAKLPNGMEIGERALAGVTSRGMICSEAELGIGPDADGIFIASEKEEIGAPIATALRLEDVVFEINLTPNRADCLGHVGLAREVALLFGAGMPVRSDRLKVAFDYDASEPGPVPIHVQAPDRCPSYAGLLVRGVTIGPSPFAVRYLLHKLGVRAISNVVDASNLVLFEQGHPVHTFDLSHLRGGRIIVRLARDGEKATTLDGVERTLSSDDLLICDAEGPVAIAGVMGCANSEIAASTRDVLIECAHFDPRSVRRTARRLGLHTDASHRFERGVDRNNTKHGAISTAAYIVELAGGKAEPRAVDVRAPEPDVRPILLRTRRAAQLLGFSIADEKIARTLHGLGCSFVRDHTGEPEARYHVHPPSWRVDLSREEDLVEELVRIEGYDAIPTTIPSVRPSSQGTPFGIRFERRVRDAAAHAGLDEAVNYAFVSPIELAHARAPQGVKLLNPLSEERSVLRTSLLPGLARNVRHAQRRNATSARLFEVAHVFGDHTLGNGERAVLGAISWGPRDAWIGDGDPVDFYDGKGVLDAIAEHLGLGGFGFGIGKWLEGAKWLHPRRSAAIDYRGDFVGWVGELHPEVADAFELSGRVVYAEVDFTNMAELIESAPTPQARPLPRFPPVARDVAMLVPEQHTAGEIAWALKDAAGGLAEEVRLFDLYRGESIPAGQKSLAFRIVYRDPEATLTDKRVEAAHGKAVDAAKKRFSATIR